MSNTLKQIVDRRKQTHGFKLPRATNLADQTSDKLQDMTEEEMRKLVAAGKMTQAEMNKRMAAMKAKQNMMGK